MAGGADSGVTVVRAAFYDARFGTLARICGLADDDHARGKMAKLWNQLLEEEVTSLTRDDVETVLGERAVEGLTRARLGRELEDGRIYLSGADDGKRVKWLGERRQAASDAGRASASGRPRDERGRLMPRRVTSETQQPASEPPAPLESLDQQPANDSPTVTSPPSPSPSPDLQDHTHPSRDRVTALAAETLTAVRQVGAELAQELGVKFMRGNPLAVEGMARAAVAGWLAVGGEAEVRDCVARLIAFRRRRALAERHLRFWVEETWWEASGIARDLGQPMDLAERRARGGDGPGGSSRQPTGAAAGADALEILRRRKQGQPP